MLRSLLTLSLLCLPLMACPPTTPADDDAADDDGANEFAPSSVDGIRIEINEDGGPTNQWTFAATTATLQGAGDFPYSYAKTGPDTSTLDFTVGGNDHYEMTWTSITGGTCTESFDGSNAVTCTFVVL